MTCRNYIPGPNGDCQRCGEMRAGHAGPVTCLVDGCAARNMIIEECAKLCDDTATLQDEMAVDPDTEESMVLYRKARAWDATVMAAKIRALKK